METPTVIDILNELLTTEHRSLARRLQEATVFVSRETIGEVEQIRQMADESREHAEWLTRLILELGGEPGVRLSDPTTADLHYQKVRHTLPRLISDHQTLIRKYSLAAQHVDSEPEASELLSRILARHREHADNLNQLCGPTTPSAV